jgi:hypothetical protein
VVREYRLRSAKPEPADTLVLNAVPFRERKAQRKRFVIYERTDLSALTAMRCPVCRRNRPRIDLPKGNSSVSDQDGIVLLPKFDAILAQRSSAKHGEHCDQETF